MAKTPQKEPSSAKHNKDKSDDRSYLKFTGIAFELVAIIGLGVWAGYKLDENSASDFPLWTILLSTLAIIMAMVFLYRKLPK